MLLSNCDNGARTALTRLREVAARTDCEIREKLAWSVGTIEFDPERHSTVESLLVEADTKMYNDKSRNKMAAG